MSDRRGGTARERLLEAAVERFRRQGFAGTSIDAICRAAGVTKGAFFHHFAGKDELMAACLQRWDAQAALHDASAPWRALDDPVERLAGSLDDAVARLVDRDGGPADLAGTAAQESDDRQVLRDGARACFDSAGRRLEVVLGEAAEAAGVAIDARALATFWMAALQGALVLAQARGSTTVVATSLGQAREHLMRPFLAAARPPPPPSPSV